MYKIIRYRAKPILISLILIALSLSLPLSLGGCASSDNEQAQQASQYERNGKNGNRGGMSMELAENQSMVMGKVSSISGNEVTLNLAEMPERKQSEVRPSGAPDMPEEAPDMPEEAPDMPEGAPDMTEEAPDMPEGAPDMPEGGRAGAISGGEANNSSDGEKRGKQFELNYTGKKATYTIPVGATVTTMNGQESTFSDIAKDNVLRLVVEQVDETTSKVVSVSIMS